MINVVNQSTGAVNYEWDFCLNDIRNLKQAKSAGSIPGLEWGSGYKLVQENGNWYGFALSFDNNKLFKLNFGGDPSNIPSITDMDDLSGQLDQPFGIEIVFSQGEWFGFIGSYSIPTGLVMLSFGSSLANTPLVSNLGNFNVTTRFMDVRAVVQGTDQLLVLIAGDPRSLVIVNFKGSFHNSVLPEDVLNTGPFSGINSPFGFDIINVNGNWIALIANTNSNEIYKLTFGSNVQTIPSVENVYTFSDVTSPIRIKILQEGLSFYAVASMQSQSVVTIDFGDFQPSYVPQLIAQPQLPVLYGMDAIRYQGKDIVQGLSDTDDFLQYLKFENNCGSSIEFSTAQSPPNFFYQVSGTEEIELIANGASGEKSIIGNFVNVLSLVAPDISFLTNGNICTGSSVEFTSTNTSGDINSYTWNFGDGSGASSSNNPSYSYASANNYSVSLNVTASNGCSNTAITALQIFNPPEANFNLPAASPICSNQNYLFTNTSTSDNGSNPIWQWNVNGADIATTQNLSYLISSTVTQNITLTASIPGCSSQSAQSILTVQDGPLVDFNTAATGCVNSLVSFTNASTGTISSYNWDFGDGNISSQANASNTFSATGTYAVTLTASNAAGCQNFLTRDISVYSNPQPDFAVEAPPYSCANYPAQFDNNTPALSDSNIATWSWSFGDAANGTSNQKNPTYTFTSDATYNVTLQAITNFGCTASKQQSIVILPSPQAAFTNNPACVNQPTQFTDASTGNMASYKWTIQSTTLTGAIPPPYVFKSAGTFSVTLTTTGNNGCKNLGSKDIIVPVLPVMDFTFQSPCTGNPTIFEELNPGGADPSVGWNWNFGSDSGINSPVSYGFPSVGVYSVTLSATRKSGCVYATSKNITIYDGPVARFTPSVQGGPAPLDVTFNNTSAADFYFWQFGDAGNSTSNLFSPEFTYTQLGHFKALLSASNSHGCTDTLSTAIYVVIPHVDLAMKAFSLLEDPNSNSSKAVVTISNLGNIPLINPEVQIDLGGNARLKEKITSTVLPGKSIQQTLSLEIVPQTLAYICAEVAPSGDVDAYNDKQCLSLANNDVVFFPYPNPSKGQINFDWISAENEHVIVTIYKSNGQVAFEQNFQFIQSGINQLTINTSSLTSGLYLIQFAGAKTKRTFHVMVAD